MDVERGKLLPLLRDARAALDVHLSTLIQLTPKGHYDAVKRETRKLIDRIDAETGRKD